MGRGICGKLLTEAEFRELTAKPPEVEAELALLREAIAGKDIKLYEYGIDPLPWGKLSKKLDIDYPHVVVMGENDVRLFGWKNGQKVMTLLSVARAVPSD
jgi:hypothetical protein